MYEQGCCRTQAGHPPIFRNDDDHGAWLHRPNTILVDSQQLESGEAMSDDFKKTAAHEIEASIMGSATLAASV